MILGYIDKNISIKYLVIVIKIVFFVCKEWYKVERYFLIVWNYFVNFLNLKKYV